MSKIMKMHGIEFSVNGEIKVSSRKVAEKFGKQHRHVMDSIRKLEENGVPNFRQSSYLNSQNKEQPEYLMDRDGFALLAMGFTGKEALEWKQDFLKAFNAMEAYVLEEEKRRADRALATMKAPEMTDAIKAMKDAEGKEAKPYHYSNEFDMINRIVLGVTAKKWREHKEMDKSDNFRDALTPVQIEAVGHLQTANTVLIETGMDYKDRKEKLDAIYKKKFAQRCLDEILELEA